MIIWTYKLLSNVRKAIAGRNHPHQLAWAVAFGLVLGLVPHGNLVALVWLLVVLTLNINHSMVAITAIASSFMAGRLDPYSHQVGDYFLSETRFHDALVTAWQWPMVAWTDLNNTIVLGSFTIAVAAMLPVFAVTYPAFRYLGRNAGKQDAQSKTEQSITTEQVATPQVATEQVATQPVATQPVATQQVATVAASTEPVAARPAATQDDVTDQRHSIVVVDQAHRRVARPRVGLDKAVEPKSDDESTVSAPASGSAASQATPKVAVETRIDVIRIADYREPTKDTKGDPSTMDDNEPMDEAFRYLLHQLRDTQQRKAA